MSFNVIEKVGEETLRTMLQDFYDRLFDDMIIGFLFEGSDKSALVDSQFDYVTAHLGDRSGTYDGPSIARAHKELPILTGMFDRRHEILRQTLEDHAFPQEIVEEWLTLDQSLRKFVVNLGAQRRDELSRDLKD